MAALARRCLFNLGHHEFPDGFPGWWHENAAAAVGQRRNFEKEDLSAKRLV